MSYASLHIEGVDWAPFDVIATDSAYRSAATAANFGDNIRAFVAQGRAQGKPVAITEFGCGTYRGAADVAAHGNSTIVWGDDGRAARLNGEYVRDEDEQATYLRELLDVFDAVGVDAAFVYTFAFYGLLTVTIPTSISTWRATAWSRCSTTRAPHAIPAAGATLTCRGSRKPRSTRWPTGSAAADPDPRTQVLGLIMV